MKELVVISGKGGTGKTSIVGSFTYLSNSKVIIDCDVDAADLHLLLKPSIKNQEPFSGGKTASIIKDKCIQCGNCINNCRFGAISNDFIIDQLGCEGCGVCYYSCPAGAISFKESIDAEWYISETINGPMIHAAMEIGAENSGKLVTHLRTEAKKQARDLNKERLLIDGSPGTGCPVIASITGANFCLIVAEPTVSGIHDLKRVLELTEKLKVKASVVINKWDINKEMAVEIEKLCHSKNIELTGKISYDETVTKAQIEGKCIIEYNDSKVAEEIKQIWNKLEQHLQEN